MLAALKYIFAPMESKRIVVPGIAIGGDFWEIVLAAGGPDRLPSGLSRHRPIGMNMCRQQPGNVRMRCLLGRAIQS
jgi:hypothetical protein